MRLTQVGPYEVTVSPRQILIVAIPALLLAGFWHIIQKTRLAGRGALAVRLAKERLDFSSVRRGLPPHF